MLSAIRELAEKTGFQSHTAAADYLEACNQLFEQGILSHSKVTHLESHVLVNLKRGLFFFQSWHQHLCKTSPGIIQKLLEAYISHL